MERKYYYCPKCGMLTWGHRWVENGKIIPCQNCGYDVEFEVNPKWNINDEAKEKIFNKVRYGEITEEEFDKEWREYCRPFIEEVVAKRPEFSRKDYDHIPIFVEQRRRHIEELDAKLAAQKSTSSSTSSSVKCPYCKSYNTKRISTMSRMISGGLFGLGSKKIGKQWHCNSCKSDF